MAKMGERVRVQFWVTKSIENDKVGRARHRNSRNQTITVEEKENRAVEASSSGSSNFCMPNQKAPCVLPHCRQFWRAGNYMLELKALKQDGRNQLRGYPMFLHSNATSHKWVFGAIAELLDNAFDEVGNDATFVHIDKISNPWDESPALLIQVGSGFKTGSMRLGADAIVFTRHMKMRTLTQSVGLLSHTFLRQMGYDRIVVPMVDYEFNSSTKAFGPIHEHAEEHFASNLSMLLMWSPYSAEKELLQQVPIYERWH